MSLIDWADRLDTPAGIGVDMVDISEICALNHRTGGAFAQRTFTARELAQAEKTPDQWSFLAGRFAVKEAVFKALARYIVEKTFDFRHVETLRREDGSPYIALTSELTEIMSVAGIKEFLVSISNESGFVVAFVAAVGDGGSH